MANSVFSGRYYRLNKLFMQQIGIWPEQSQAARIMLPLIFILIIGSILVPELVKMLDVLGDTDNVLECIPAMLIIIASWIKMLNGSVNQKSIKKLIERVEYDWKKLSNSPSSIVILKKYAEQGRMITVAYAGFLFFSIACFNSLPLVPLVMNVIVPLNETRPKKFLYEAEYRVDTEKYYYYMLFHSYLTSFMCILIYITVDTEVSTWVQHCCALFEIVSYNLKYASEKDNPETSEVYPIDDIKYRNICFCVKQHNDAISFANLIESTYSFSLGLVTGLTMIVMSISGVLVLIKIDDFEDVLRFTVLTLAPGVNLYFNTIPGQKLIDHSQEIYVAAYESDWFNFPLRAQKLLVVVLSRAQRPCMMTAGKVYLINIESFSTVVKTSVSYFTVLSSLR